MGDGWVTGQFGREIIHVGKYEGRFARVMLVVTNSSIEVRDVVIPGRGPKARKSKRRLG
jgi:hypothetical protein